MAGFNNSQRIGKDKFGNDQIVKGIREKDDGGLKGAYVEIGGKLYKIFVSPSNKEGVRYWVSITKVQKRQSGTF
ncbi:MAG: hypothetical protein ACQEQ0_08700 [Bacteroidota bacterium]